MAKRDEEKEKRLAAALRENLKRRKAQARAILPGTGRDGQVALSPGQGFGSRDDPNLPIATRSGVVEGAGSETHTPLHQASPGPPPRPGED